MYTNIQTDFALATIATYLREHDSDFPKVHVEMLIEALTLVMENNVFHFGDLIFQQIQGTAMGTPPAPPYATLFFATFEDAILDQFGDSLFLYRRFIDDVVGIWLRDSDDAMDDSQWQDFKAMMNEDSGLEWIVQEQSTSVDFMDLSIRIDGQKIHTTLYQKAMNLHLYIPPHSAHPPGVLTGVVLGGIHRIYTLCSDSQDIKKLLKEFYKRLAVRGYKRSALEPLFVKGLQLQIARQTAQSTTKPQIRSIDDNTVFLHIKYNPGDPKSHVLQQHWRDTVAAPKGRTKLQYLRNYKSDSMALRRMTVAYSRCENLGNLLSYRKLPENGLPASSFIGLDA
jgi:hypothetical protein